MTSQNVTSIWSEVIWELHFRELLLPPEIIFNQFPSCSEPESTVTLSVRNLRMESFNVALIFSFLVCLVILVAKAV